MSVNSANFESNRGMTLSPDQAAQQQEVIGVGLICTAAGLSLAASVILFFKGQVSQGLFVGLWVPSILSLGSLLRGRAGR